MCLLTERYASHACHELPEYQLNRSVYSRRYMVLWNTCAALLKLLTQYLCRSILVVKHLCSKSNHATQRVPSMQPPMEEGSCWKLPLAEAPVVLRYGPPLVGRRPAQDCLGLPAAEPLRPQEPCLPNEQPRTTGSMSQTSPAVYGRSSTLGRTIQVRLSWQLSLGF